MLVYLKDALGHLVGAIYIRSYWCEKLYEFMMRYDSYITQMRSTQKLDRLNRVLLCPKEKKKKELRVLLNCITEREVPYFLFPKHI